MVGFTQLENSWSEGGKLLNHQGNYCFIETVPHLDHVEKLAKLKYMSYHFPSQPFDCTAVASILTKEIRENQKWIKEERDLKNKEWTGENRNIGTSMNTEVDRAGCKRKRWAHTQISQIWREDERQESLYTHRKIKKHMQKFIPNDLQNKNPGLCSVLEYQTRRKKFKLQRLSSFPT